jgi:glycosyltransferase involved in cell wall biosynthesis
MRIGLDCQSLSGGVRHGFSTYLGNLLRELRARYPQHQFIEWPCRQGSGWRLPNQLWWDQVQVPRLARRDHVDVLHTPAFSGPVLRSCPLVMTVHDLLYTRYPEWLPTARSRWYWGRWIPWTAQRASAVIAPSESTKRDLVDLIGISQDRIHVVPEAVDPHFFARPSPAEITAYRAKRGLAEPYILYVGSIDRRKDLGGLIRAFALAHSRLKGYRLVIAGHLIPGRSDLADAVRASGLAGEILLPGYVPDDELQLLYAGASLFVYPSWWEGFGLPPLEAMAQGVPVITYRSSSLPEVVGDAAVLIDPPFSADALADAMVRVLEHEPLRSSLIGRGLRQAGKFSWTRAAEQTMAVYLHCLENEQYPERRTAATTAQR